MLWRLWRKRKVVHLARALEPVADAPRPRAGVSTVLVAEDHPIIREGVRRALGSQPDLQLCAEASDGEEALRAIERHRPDVAVLEIGMPKLGGLEILRLVRERYPATRTLLIAVRSDPTLVDQAVRLGADGYLPLEETPKEIVEAIREIAKGGIYW